MAPEYRPHRLDHRPPHKKRADTSGGDPTPGNLSHASLQQLQHVQMRRQQSHMSGVTVTGAGPHSHLAKIAEAEQCSMDHGVDAGGSRQQKTSSTTPPATSGLPAKGGGYARELQLDITPTLPAAEPQPQQQRAQAAKPKPKPKPKPNKGLKAAAARLAKASNAPPAPSATAAEGAAVATPLVIVTFQTRSRETARRLQEEAAKANRRYVPPARDVYQQITCPMTEPPNPTVLESLEHYPVLRIGDTIECRFQPKTAFENICQGTELPPCNQTALSFETRFAEGKSVVIRQLEFEAFYYSFVDGLVCLRCQRQPGSCSCGYASDLLEINRDWKAKRDPSRRLGLRLADDGSVTVALRIPRIRRPLTDDEAAAGCTAALTF